MTAPYYDHAGIVIYHGDNNAVLPVLANNSIDSIVTDPPYGISLMNKKWDYDIPTVEQFGKMFQALKPGGHMPHKYAGKTAKTLDDAKKFAVEFAREIA